MYVISPPRASTRIKMTFSFSFDKIVSLPPTRLIMCLYSSSWGLGKRTSLVYWIDQCTLVPIVIPSFQIFTTNFNLRNQSHCLQTSNEFYADWLQNNDARKTTSLFCCRFHFILFIFFFHQKNISTWNHAVTISVNGLLCNVLCGMLIAFRAWNCELFTFDYTVYFQRQQKSPFTCRCNCRIKEAKNEKPKIVFSTQIRI